MKILNLLLIILPLISGLCLSLNAFAQANALSGLPTGATNRIGKGRVNEIKYFPERHKTRHCQYYRHLDLRCADR